MNWILNQKSEMNWIFNGFLNVLNWNYSKNEHSFISILWISRKSSSKQRSHFHSLLTVFIGRLQINYLVSNRVRGSSFTEMNGCVPLENGFSSTVHSSHHILFMITKLYQHRQHQKSYASLRCTVIEIKAVC